MMYAIFNRGVPGSLGKGLHLRVLQGACWFTMAVGVPGVGASALSFPGPS